MCSLYNEIGEWMSGVIASWPELGKSARQCAALIAAVDESAATHQPIRDMKQALSCKDDALERALLAYSIQESQQKIDALPVAYSVHELIRQQFQLFGQAPGGPGPSLAVDAEENDPFLSACKICTL